MVSNMNKILDEIGNNTAKLNELTQLLAKMQDQDEKFQKNILTLIENLGSEITGKLDNIIGKFDQYDFSLEGVEQLLAKIQAQDFRGIPRRPLASHSRDRGLPVQIARH